MRKEFATATLRDLRGPVTGEEPVLNELPLPGGARIAVTIQLAVEAWSGTAVSGSTLGSELTGEAIRRGTPDWATISAQEYGIRTGIWRILDVLERHEVVASCSISGLVAERWPALVRVLAEKGHEIVGHGYSQDRVMSGMAEEEDYDTVARSTEILEKTSGQRPVGWSSHGSRRGDFTVLSLLKLGYLYSNDFRDADAPYVAASLWDRQLVAMPRTDEINDIFVVRRHGAPPSAYVEFFRRAFDQLYEEGQRHPKVLSCVVHGTLFGRPWGVSALGECLDYAMQFPGVRVCTRREIAKVYADASPVSGAGKGE